MIYDPVANFETHPLHIEDRKGRLVPRVFKKKASKSDQKHSWKVFDANEQCHDVAR